MRGATRGDGVRGEDVTANVRTIRAHAACARGGPAGPRRDSRRGLPAADARSSGSTRSSASAGEPLFANPRNTAAGAMRNLDPGAGRQARPVGVDLSDRHGRPRRARSRTHAAMLERLKRVGRCRSSRTGSAATGIDAVWAFCEQWRDEAPRASQFETDGVVVKLDRPRAARAAGGHVEVPALGDGVQVPGASRRRLLHRDRRQHRPHWRGHAVCGARARVRRRLDGLDGHAAQSRRHRPQGHPRRRHRDRREGRRCHPARRRAGAPRSGRPTAAVGDADRVPGVRQPAAQARRRGGVALREQLVPGQAEARHRALRVARRDEHRRAWANR